MYRQRPLQALYLFSMLLVRTLSLSPHALWKQRTSCRFHRGRTQHLMSSPVDELDGAVSQGSDNFDLASSSSSTSSSSQTTLNICKTIVGTGLLTLPSGVARVSESSGALESETLALSAVCLVVFACLSGYGFFLIGRVCVAVGADSYAEAWRRSVGAGTAWVPAAASILLCFTGAVKACCVVGDYATDLLSFFLQVPYDALPHAAVVAGVSLSLFAPLCSLRSLSPLAVASLLGLIGSMVTAAAMVSRLVDGSYAVGGEFFDVAAWTPCFSAPPLLDASGGSGGAGSGLGDDWTRHLPTAGGLGIFLALCSDSFLSHYSAPTLFSELAPTAVRPLKRSGVPSDVTGSSDSDSTSSSSSMDATALQGVKLRAFAIAVRTAFGLSLLLFLLVASAGFATFGTAAQANILNNYASVDSLAACARAGVGICVLFEFPLLERPFRMTLVGDVLKMPQAASSTFTVLLSVGIITATSLAGVPLDKLSALSGASGGALLSYLGPALMTYKLYERAQRGDGSTDRDATGYEGGESLLTTATRRLRAESQERSSNTDAGSLLKNSSGLAQVPSSSGQVLPAVAILGVTGVLVAVLALSQIASESLSSFWSY